MTVIETETKLLSATSLSHSGTKAGEKRIRLRESTHASHATDLTESSST